MLSLLKPLKSLLEIGYLLFDSAQLCLVLYSAQVVLSKFLSDVVLKLTSQDPEIRIAPYRTFAVLQCAGLDAVDNEVSAHAVFRLGCDVAQRRSLAIPFTVFRHDVLFPPHTPYRGHCQQCPCRVGWYLPAWGQNSWGMEKPEALPKSDRQLVVLLYCGGGTSNLLSLVV